MNLREILKYDLYRYSANIGKKSFVRTYFLVPGFNYIVWLRLTQKYNNKFMKFLLKRKMIRFGIEIRPETKIGKGFYIGHWGGIVINDNVKIGMNCNISQGVTIGSANRGKKIGVPVIGDNVYIGPGAKIFGKISIGSNVAIGANAVVINDVPDNMVVGGIPAKVISKEGSTGYINKVLNDQKEQK